ncbi:ATP-binding protein [Agriterribacter sp.]|uniref:ATP-binding protein n=1 Tax=Agriterribacter sp. TaxID=2821509 RepID=UPI002D06C328|nr:ATP-binding protein [Agriterribacter sp.]HRO48139.1 ATP-binding protein [Agriterribacter sp.]HRQ16233.1 ATP-binding protein [Agriterribacter sp.]
MNEVLTRAIESRLKSLIGKNKVLLILGTRRVGKTVLINKIVKEYNKQVVMLNGEDLNTQEILQQRTAANYKRIAGDAQLLVIDEAQAIPETGKVLKLMIDSLPDLTIIATGSSSFDLLNKAGEPLTGRKIQFQLYPIAQMELESGENFVETRQHLEERLVFGSYPEIIQLPSYREKEEYLQELVQSYLLKDILAFEGIRQSNKIMKLLRLIAFQTGSEVSYNELGNQLGISKNTVESYLDLLSKVFLIYRLPAYSTNQRKEISKGSKWYFADNGIRNAIASDLRLLNLRQDTGSLWENYLLSERIKRNSYLHEHVQYFFWRNYDQQEVDLIELKQGKLHAWEFKYNNNKKVKIPAAFSAAYPEALFECITKDNYLDWITAAS